MHEGVLSDKQKKLLPLLKNFPRFGLVGGTAIALHLGHRRSVDFDLATIEKLETEKVINTIKQNYSIERTLIDEINELTIIINSVKFTFFHYPFMIEFNQKLDQHLVMPDLLTLASMKAYALGRRAKWKDYVDLYFVFKEHSLVELITKSKEIFKNEFNEKFFREQLSYFADIDYSEQIDYMPNSETDDDAIKETLTQISLQSS